MYSKDSKIITSKEELSNYISGIDVYSSELLVLISKSDIPREIYQITDYEYRPDLIAEDYYGSSKFMGLLMLQAGRGLEYLTRGSCISLIPKKYLLELISTLGSTNNK